MSPWESHVPPAGTRSLFKLNSKIGKKEKCDLEDGLNCET